MQAVDIRVLNGREYDLNSYTVAARELAVHLFAEYEYLITYLDILEHTYRTSWIYEDNNKLDVYKADKHRLRVFMERTENKLIELEKDPMNHKGITLRKLYRPFDILFSSKWYMILLSIFYAYLAVDRIVHGATFLMTGLDIVLAIVCFYFFIQQSKRKGSFLYGSKIIRTQ